MSPLRHTDGSRIRVGHRVIYNNQAGTIVVVIDDAEGSPGFPIEDWSSQKTGLVIRFDNGAVLQLESSDARLVRDKMIRPEPKVALESGIAPAAQSPNNRLSDRGPRLR